jgi:D-lactate dehydrogenase
MDVMFYEIFKEEEKALKLFLPPTVRAGFSAKAIQECAAKPKPPATLISVRTQSIIPGEWAPKLQGILTRSTGYDHILSYRKQTNTYILAGHLPHYCSRAVAEHGILAMLALLRKLKIQIKHFDAFDRSGLTGSECFKKSMLVIGVGRIGSQVVDMARGLRMNVRGVDPEHKINDLDYVKLSDGVSWADVIVCAAPLTDETRGMLNYDVLKDTRPGAVLINVSRGEISPIKDLNRLLSEKILGGIGLDVYEHEGLLAASLRSGERGANESIRRIQELKDRPNVLFTPHNAFNAQEALERKAEQSIESVTLFLEKKTFPYPVPDDGLVTLKI